MTFTSETVEALVDQFTRLPTIGRKTAQRLAAFVMKMPREEVVEIARALVAVKDKVRNCAVCGNVTDEDLCGVCTSPRRDAQTICVVEEPNDVMAFERTGEYGGVYHVLGGAISPLEGIGPEELRVRELVARVSGALTLSEDARARIPGARETGTLPPAREVILAMNPNVEGDTTAYYVGQLLAPFGIAVTRIARGLPIGGDLEFADEATLSRALEGRAGL